MKDNSHNIGQDGNFSALCHICHTSRMFQFSNTVQLTFRTILAPLTRVLRSGTEQGAGIPHLPGCRSSPSLEM